MSTEDPNNENLYWDHVIRAAADLELAQNGLREAKRLGDMYQKDGHHLVSECTTRIERVIEDLKRVSQQQPQGSSCFPATALVATPLGERLIASFRVGDTVLSWSPRTGRLVEQLVTRVLVHAPCDLWRVRIHGGCDVTTTPNHRFLTSRGWVRADRLRPGDTLVRPNGDARAVPVLAIKAGARHEAAYNLFTTGEHSFVVDGFVAHNFTDLRALRTWWHRLVIDRWPSVRRAIWPEFADGPTSVIATEHSAQHRQENLRPCRI